MGSPKKQRRKFSKPLKMWDTNRIKRESDLVKKYGLKNRRELWKLSFVLKRYQMQAKRLLSIKNAQDEKEKKGLMDSLTRLGILNPSSDLNTILGLTVDDLLKRRLQSIVYSKHMARTLKQARQMITHEHVFVAGNKITIPSYLVNVEEENLVIFSPDSQFKSEDHPERFVEEVKEVPDNQATKEEEKPKEEKKKVEKKETKSKVEKPKVEEKKVEVPKKEAPKEAETKVEEKKEEKVESNE